MKASLYLAVLVFPLSSATADDAAIARLQKDIAELSSRIEVLEAQNQRLQGDTDDGAQDTKLLRSVSDSQRSDSSRFQLQGDFRYRYETIDLEGDVTQSRSRIRARAGFSTDMNEYLEVGFGVATGEFSPVSSTQTLGDGGSKKPIALDLAYLDWEPANGLHLMAGKFRNHLFRVPSQTLLWDDEWRPEGFGVQYDNESFFASFLGTWLESDTLALNREWAAGAQAGTKLNFGNTHFIAGAGYFDFDTAGKGMFFGSDLAFAGNSYYCPDPQNATECSFLLDYEELEVFAALDFTINDLDATIYGHALRNLAADEFNSGWTIGARLLKSYRDQQLQFDYFYRELGADAVYAQLTDSDFGGGGSDVRGHVLKAGWSRSARWQLSMVYFMNETGIDSALRRDYDRLQLNVDLNY